MFPTGFPSEAGSWDPTLRSTHKCKGWPWGPVPPEAIPSSCHQRAQAAAVRGLFTWAAEVLPQRLLFSHCNFCYCVVGRRNVDLKNNVDSQSLSLTSIEDPMGQSFEGDECPRCVPTGEDFWGPLLQHKDFISEHPGIILYSELKEQLGLEVIFIFFIFYYIFQIFYIKFNLL